MQKVKDLLFIHELSSPCHLAVLAESIGISTQVVSSIEEALSCNSEGRYLCLLPQTGLSLDAKGLPLQLTKLVAEMPVALFQVQPKSIDENACILLGVQGVLYNNLSMDLLLTGLKKMLEGELWYDRTTLSKVISELVHSNEPAGSHISNENRLSVWRMLTLREKTIIQLVSSGARNKEIANRLCISEHTVKTHISSIFRKTQSRNRVELLRWSNHHHAKLA
ncbi:DNA-binding response regulator [Parashewanella curva]|uniref:DNA-binding response regulator n=1 Tax=Parashewanella curva TaxID=2338552 RepID=A0A3L8Q163_9GAMM|nr:response regulator transcription factor [Parashewanella curva]RLV60558.1 DNA-binding response regulator [Parashewanella curva]